MFIETSRPRRKGDKARLVSPTLMTNTNKQNAVCTVSLLLYMLSNTVYVDIVKMSLLNECIFRLRRILTFEDI